VRGSLQTKFKDVVLAGMPSVHTTPAAKRSKESHVSEHGHPMRGKSIAP